MLNDVRPGSDHGHSEAARDDAVVQLYLVGGWGSRTVSRQESFGAMALRMASFQDVIAVDGGVRHCIAMGITPSLIIGDFDSALSSDVAICDKSATRCFPSNKDMSDTELGLNAAFESGADQVVIFSALGGRTDHSLANLMLLCRYPGKVKIETECETIYAISDYKKEVSYPGQTISLIPIAGKVENVSSRGLKWELAGAVLNENFISLSNVVEGEEFEIWVGQGTLLCVIQNVSS